eukprot:COSAG06_NODE_1274_length_10048_cov_5.593628_7_plen_185_part_00
MKEDHLPRQARDKHRERAGRSLVETRTGTRFCDTCAGLHCAVCPGRLQQSHLGARNGPFFAVPFYILANDHFTKTGSGQTQGKHSKQDVVFRRTSAQREGWADRLRTTKDQRTHARTLAITSSALSRLLVAHSRGCSAQNTLYAPLTRTHTRVRHRHSSGLQYTAVDRKCPAASSQRRDNIVTI